VNSLTYLGGVERIIYLLRISGQEEIKKDLPWGDAKLRSRTYEELVRQQTTLNERLAALFPVGGFGDLPGGSADLPVRVRRMHIQRRNAGPVAPVEVFFVAHGWRDAFWLSMAALLEAFGSALRRCPVCTAVYRKNRRQAYCSLRCSNRKRQKDFYRAHRKPVVKAGRLKR